MPLDVAVALAAARLSFAALGSVRGAVNQRAVIRSLEQIKSDIERIERKTDALLVSDLLAAFSTLANIARDSAPESRSVRLAFAEERLLASTGLDTNEILAGDSGSLWLSRVHFGLAFLAHLRDDEATVTLHIAQVFICEPRLAREEVFPHFYESVLGAAKNDADTWLRVQADKLEADVEEFRQRAQHGTGEPVSWKEVARVLGPAWLVVMLPGFFMPAIIVAIATGGLALSNPKIMAALVKLMRSSFGTPDQRTAIYRATREASLKAEFEEKLDKRTRELAIELRGQLLEERIAQPEPAADG